MTETPHASTRRPVAIDLFSGAGGLSLGFESAGFDVVAAVEYDPVHAATHLYNFPLTDVLCADVSTVTADRLLESARRGWELHNPGQEWDGIVDAIIGGPSCQGFSSMGRQDASDERNQLLLEFVRLVTEVRPLSFCMENVPGLLDPRFDSIRGKALNALRAAGYRFSGHEVPLKAEDYGVPQKRRRVVILGVLDSDTPPETPEPQVTRAFTVADAFIGLPDEESLLSIGRTEFVTVSKKLRAARTASSGAYSHLAGTFGDGSASLGHQRVVDHSVLSGYRMTLHSASSARRFAATPQGSKEPISRLYRLANDAPSLTLRAGTGRERGAFSAARPIHPTEPRVVTAREAARLHSFPDWFRFHTTNWHAHRQIGNSVPPLLAAAAGRSLRIALGAEVARSARPAVVLGETALLSLSPTQAAERMKVESDQVPKRRRQHSAVPASRMVVAAEN